MLYNKLTNIVLTLFCGFASNYPAMESNKNEAGMNNEGTCVFGLFTTKLNCGWN